jgi:hypothetical protein
MATSVRQMQALDPSGTQRLGTGSHALRNGVRAWFAVTFIGQLLFTIHIVSFYGRTAASGHLTDWNKHLSPGYVPGDSVGNASLALHLAMAALLTCGGLLQLIPQIRIGAPMFHRWVGRIYVAAAFLGSLSALYLVLIRRGLDDTGDHHVSLVLNAVIIMLCAVMAYRHARARRFALHSRWATRLFLAVSGVWFFRVGLFFWILINGGPVGFNADTFQGPFLVFLGFAQYLLPLGVLQLYLHARDRGGLASKYAMAVALAVMAVATAIGIFGHAMYMVKSGAAV